MSFSFTSTQPAQQSTFGTPSFGAPPASNSFSFGTTTAAPTTGAAPFSFGTTPAPQAGGFQLGTNNAPASNAFGFGSTTQAAPAFSFSSGSLNTGTTTSMAGNTLGTTSFGSGFGLGLSSSAGLTGLTTNVMTTAASAPSVGLGGINSTPFGGDLATSNLQGKSDSKAFNEMIVPAEIAQSVDEFKKHVKEQKAKKDEVSRGSSKAPEKVGEEVETLKNILSNLANNIQQHSALVHKLKHDVALEIKNAEIAQRTKETAPSMQLDNTAPLRYFMHLVSDFEERMQFYKQQIEDTERNLLAISKQHALTPQELMGTMKKLHEAFVLLAGRVHVIHTSLQNYKDDYLTYRRRVLGDPTDIFASKSHTATKSALVSQLNKIGSGPSPFGGTSDPLSRTLNHLTSSVQISGGGIGGSSGTGSGSINFGSSLASSSLLPSSNQGLSFGTPARPAAGLGFFGSSTQTLPSANSSFQLQSPPPGNKRNKR
nr:EOG090X0D34 [Scapholeberis mucronata]